MTAPGLARVDAGLLAELTGVLGAARVSTAPAVCEHHGRDESYHPAMPPDAVVFCRTTDEVAAVVTACAARRVPVIPYGTGTSLEGHVAALEGGVCIDLSGMDKILRLDPEAMDVTVEAGVRRKQLNAYLRDTGLFFPVDPGADASIGGMTATRASGTNAVRYGTMRDAVMALTVVMADGSILKTGGRARKSSAGYDLTRLLVGSEGTLGVITEITLRLHGIPEVISSAVCPFPDLESAVNTVILAIQTGIPVARMEVLDEVLMAAVNAYSDLDYAVSPTLFFEFHGSEAGAADQIEQVRAIAAEFGGTGFRWASRQEDRNRLWQARHDAYYATLALKPGAKGIATDVCVPISALAENILAVQEELRRSDLTAAILGHVGDGNFHVVLAVDPDDEVEMARARGLNDRMVARAIEAGGTCTGEHGIGLGKIAFLEREQGAGVDVMRAVKQALDPLNIMNPGKILRT